MFSPKNKYHTIIANFFQSSTFCRRKARELPWQLLASDDFERLYLLYSNLPFFHLAWRTDRYETREFWMNIEKSGNYSLTGAYQPLIKSLSDEKIGYSEDITDLFLETSHIKEAIPLLEFQVQYYRRKDHPFHLLRSVSNYANALREAGMFGPAMKWYSEQEKVAQNGGHQREYCTALGNQASILILQTKFDFSMDFLTRQEKLARSLDDLYNLVICLSNQSVVSRYRGETAKAKELLSEALKIARETDRELLAACDHNQGVLMYDDADEKEAGLKFASSLEEFTRIGSTGRMSAALGNLAVIEIKNRNLQRAIEYLNQQEDICIRNDDQTTLQVCLYNKAMISLKQEKTDIALNLLLRSEKTARRLEMTEGICKSLIGQALVSAKAGESRKAGIFLKEAGNFAGVNGLFILQKEIESLEGIDNELDNTTKNINGWIIPIVLVSHLSVTGRPVEVRVESELLMPDWSLLDEEGILLFIKNGGNPLLTDKDGGTALMAAASLRSKDLIENLIDLKVEVNAQDTDGTTALMIASNKGDTEIMHLLIAAGAYVNHRKTDGFTPLLFAIQSGNPDGVRLLLNSGADPNSATIHGLSPVHLAAYNCSQVIFNELIRNGADPMKKTIDRLTAYDILRDKCPEMYKSYKVNYKSE